MYKYSSVLYVCMFGIDWRNWKTPWADFWHTEVFLMWLGQVRVLNLNSHIWRNCDAIVTFWNTVYSGNRTIFSWMESNPDIKVNRAIILWTKVVRLTGVDCIGKFTLLTTVQPIYMIKSEFQGWINSFWVGRINSFLNELEMQSIRYIIYIYSKCITFKIVHIIVNTSL